MTLRNHQFNLRETVKSQPYNKDTNLIQEKCSQAKQIPFQLVSQFPLLEIKPLWSVITAAEIKQTKLINLNKCQNKI